MHIFCSGIGGIGLSAYAALQHDAGHAVFGSDRQESAMTRALAAQGVPVSYCQDGSALSASCDLFVYSEALPADAPERRIAAERGVRSISYFHALGELSAAFRVIAVCGTHGKSSTTAMAAKMLMDAGQDPTVVVGTCVPDLGGRNWRRGSSDIFLLEACEYRRSFHYLSPSVVLMTNVDGDHFDAFGSLQEYQNAFLEFLRLLPTDGTVITHGDDADCTRIAQESGRRFMDADVFPLPELAIPGVHMQRNAQLVLALAEHCGIVPDTAASALRAYRGSARRLEYKGEWRGIPVYDDYAHHPVEIRATVRAVREAHPGKRIVVVFQPHTHDRTLKLYDAFIQSFVDADAVVVCSVYDARHEIERGELDRNAFVRDIAQASGTEAYNGGSLAEAETLLTTSVLVPEDVLLVMGAGDSTQLAQRLVAQYP